MPGEDTTRREPAQSIRVGDGYEEVILASGVVVGLMLR